MFLEQQNKIIKFIEDNYKNYLKDIQEPEIINDFMDLDKYKNGFLLFIDFDKAEFPQSNPYKDDCSNIERLFVSIYLVCRNDTPKNLNEKTLFVTDAFFRMIKEKPINNMYIDSNLNVEFFKFVEGTKYLTASQFELIFNIEV